MYRKCRAILPMPTGISPEKLLYERSREVKYVTCRVMFEGMGPEKLLFDRSSTSKLVQYLRPRGNWPARPKLLRRNAETLFSLGSKAFQHSTPVNWHMKPSVVLSKFHDDFSMPLGSITDCFTVLRHLMSSSEPMHDDDELAALKSIADMAWKH
jgi:hypothetical protein